MCRELRKATVGLKAAIRGKREEVASGSTEGPSQAIACSGPSLGCFRHRLTTEGRVQESLQAVPCNLLCAKLVNALGECMPEAALTSRRRSCLLTAATCNRENARFGNDLTESWAGVSRSLHAKVHKKLICPEICMSTTDCAVCPRCRSIW